MSTQVYVIAQFRGKSDKIDQLVEMLTELTAQTRQESGCIEYGFYQSTDNPVMFSSFEVWENLASEEAHWQTQHIQHALARLPELTEGEAQIIKYRAII